VTLAPRTLFGRNVLLLLALFLLSLTAGVLTLREWVQKPRITELAALVARHARLVYADLLTTPESRRGALQVWLDSSDAIRVLPAAAAAPPAPPVLPARAARQFAQNLRLRLPSAEEIRWVPNDHGTVWIRVAVGAQQYWLIERGVFLVGDVPLVGIAALAVFTVLSFAGAALIQWRVNRPLVRLAAAAKTLAAGNRITLLSEEGPEELALVSRAFNQMSASLERADAERAVLLAGVSHDVRTPIAKLRLAIEMLTGSADAGLVDSMRRSTAELEAVTGQFLHYARSEVPGERVEIDLNSIVIDCVDRHQRGAYGQANARAVRAQLGDPCSIALHPESIHRALDNLIQNALRYGDGAVEVETSLQQGIARVSVLDRGPGIPAEEVQALKMPFARGSASTGTPGAGLGLAIVERIARAHHARFDLLPRKGGGLEARLEFAAGCASLPKVIPTPSATTARTVITPAKHT
jgi:two-component system, OmpR family, osmolarity sensor histidine kinase EnvZ